MAEYRIGAVIDPSGVTQGAAKVEQDLHRVDAAATTTKAKLEGAFKGGGADVAALDARLSSIEKTLVGVASASAAAAAQTKALTQSVDQVATTVARATVNHETYASAQTRAVRAGNDNTRSLAAQRAGYQNLSTQITQVATSLASGASPLSAFSANAFDLVQALLAIGGGGGGGGGGDSPTSAITDLNESIGTAKDTFENASGAAEKLSGALGGSAAASEAGTAAAAGNTSATGANAAAHGASATATSASAAATAAAALAAAEEAASQTIAASVAAGSAVTHVELATSVGVAAAAAAYNAGATIEEAAALGAAAASAHIMSLGLADVTVASVVAAAAATATATAFTAEAIAMELAAANAAALAARKAALTAFISGPWGVAILAATAIVATLAYKYITATDSVDDLVKKMKESAAQAALTAKAHDIFAKSAEGVADAIDKQNVALKKSLETQAESEKAALAQAKAQLVLQVQIRNTTLALIAQEEARLKALQSRGPTSGDARGDLAIRGTRDVQNRLADLAEQAAAEQASLEKAQENVRLAEIPVAQRDIANQLDAQKAATDRYAEAVRKLNVEKSKGAITDAQYRASLLKEDLALKAAIAAAQKAEKDAKDAERDAKRTGGFTTLGSPVSGPVTSGFGHRGSPGGVGTTDHKGIDYGVAPGTPVRATAAGTVDFAGKRGGYGNVVVLNLGAGTTTRDAHLRAILVKDNQQVEAGDIIGLSGGVQGEPGAGNAQGRGHLHHELRLNGRAVDPRKNPRVPTDAADAADKAEIDAEKLAEQQADFVQSLVDSADARGRGGARAESLQAKIDKALADFKRRFDREAGPDESKAITAALTDADAREIAQRFDQAYSEPLKRLQALQGKTGIDRDILNAQLEETAKIGRDLTPVEAALIDNSIRRADALDRETGILESLRQPLEDYKTQIAALNKLLAEGKISQVDFNASLGQLGAPARDILSNVEGVDPKTGQTYADVAAKAEEESRYADEAQKTRDNREELLKLGIDYDALELAQKQKHSDNLLAIDQARTSTMLQAGQSVADSLLQIAESSIGKQNAVYKTLFVASKAFAIADAVLKIQTAIANAAALPPPANIPFIIQAAALGASIISNIQSVALNLADGGLIRGPGGPRDDRIPVNASDGEYMVQAAAVARPGNLALLDAMNNGRVVAGARRQSANDNAGGYGRQRSRVTVHQYPGTAVEVRDTPDDDHIEFIARQAVAKEAPRAVASALRNPSSRVSKAMSSGTTARRKRG